MNPGVTTTPKEKEREKNERQAPKLPHQRATREGVEPETEQRERPKANVRSESGAKATVNAHEATVSEETRQAQDEKNRRGSGSSHSLNLTEAIAPKASLGDQVNRHPGACIVEKPPDEAVDREASPNTSTSGSHHSNQEETSQYCDSQALKSRPGEPGKENHFQFHASLRVKTVTIGGTEKWPKQGGGPTGMTVSKTRHRHQPKTSHHLQETSQARFLQLDKTKNEENHPVQRQSGQARENLHKPSGSSPKVKSRIGQGTGDGADPLTRRRGRQATINTRAEIRHRHGRMQTPARRLERQQSTVAAGRTTLRRLQ